MLVKRKIDNVELEVLKLESGSYMLPNGVELSKADMTEQFIPIKPKVVKSTEPEINIPPPSVEFVGDDLSGIFKAISIASGQMVNLNKGKEAFNYKYITLGQVIDMTRKPLMDNGLSIMNFTGTYFIGKQLMARTEVVCSHDSGSRISSVFDVPVDANKKQALVQSIATVHSYCVRYHRVNLLGIAGQDDTDGV